MADDQDDVGKAPTGKGSLIVPRAAAGTRLDRFLAEAFPRHSRRSLMKVIRSGEVRANGIPARPGLLLRAGDRLDMPPLDEAVGEAVGEAPSRARGAAVESPVAAGREDARADLPRGPDVPVLYRDADLLVVSKPAGVPCHAGAGLGATRTLLELLREDVLAGFGLVHRLDRDTSGAIALVREPARRAAAAARFAQSEADDAEGHAVEKVYDALVEGVPEAPSGTVDLPLADPGHGTKGRVDERHGRRALTEWALVEAFPGVLGRGAARLRVVPRTGRTHQIRLHLAAIGHPLLVDPLYGRRKGWRLVDPKGGPAAKLTRTPLHAASLTLPHPTTGEPVTVHAPLFPDHRRALEVLRTVVGKQDASGGA